MRTTLDLDDDVIEAVRELARMRREPLGAVLSSLARAALRPASVEIVDGIPLIRARPSSPVITSEMVRRSLDDE